MTVGRAISNYGSEVAQGFGDAWNRFWFTPSDPLALAALRVGTGLMALWFVGGYTPHLNALFGPEGMLPVTLVDQVRGEGWTSFSLLDYARTSSELWVAHIFSLLVLLLFTVGVFTRVTSIAALVVVLSYIHRAPILTAQFEPVLAFVLFYLCLGPSGAALSFDHWRSERAGRTLPERRYGATVAMRLIQVHLSLVYLAMGVAKIAEPADSWWLGEAVWWLIARPETRVIDLTAVTHDQIKLLNAWTHAIVLFEIGFGLLIWVRLARPLLLALAVVMWTSLALISGLVPFCAVMLVANLAFVESSFWRSLFKPAAAQPATVAA